MKELKEAAKFITELTWETVPDKAREAVVLHVLDSVGAAIGAAGNEQVRSVSDAWRGMDETTRISVWGQNRKMSLGNAVFLNAMMGHTLEMDDVHTTSKTHIGTVVIPAAWGLAEETGASGKEFLEAVLCGYEVMSRIGMAFGVSAHRNQGWHVTATAGTFGAAAAGAKLLGLDPEKTVYALGLAGAQSFGTWAFLGDGVSCKTLNPARAAQSGIEAALLAKAGMSGPTHILTGKDGGLFQMMTDGARPELVSEGMGSVWQVLYVDNKPYPSCRSTHCVIDATLQICRDHEVKAADIDHIDIDTYQVGHKQCGVSEGSVRPRTAVHAKFSSPYVTACAVICGEVTLRQFEPAVIEDPEIQALLRRIRTREDKKFTGAYPEHWGCAVHMYGKDGSQYDACVEDASGSVANPLTREQVKEKAIALMRETSGKYAKELAERILNLEQESRIFAL